MRLFATVFLLAHPVASTFMTNPVDAAGFPLDIVKSVDVTKTCPGTDQGCYSRAVGSSSTLLGLSAASGKRRAFVSIDNTGLDTNSPNGGVAVIDVVSGQVERFWDMIKPNGGVTKSVVITKTGDALYFVSDALDGVAYLHKRNLTDLFDNTYNWDYQVTLTGDIGTCVTSTKRGLTLPLLVDNEAIVLIGDTDGYVVAISTAITTETPKPLWQHNVGSCILADLSYDKITESIAVLTAPGKLHVLTTNLPPAAPPASIVTTSVVLILLGVGAAVIVVVLVIAAGGLVAFLVATGRLQPLVASIKQRSSGGGGKPTSSAAQAAAAKQRAAYEPPSEEPVEYDDVPAATDYTADFKQKPAAAAAAREHNPFG